MSSRFLPLTLDEFTELLRRFDFARRIDAIHLHHTWRPDHGQYRGEATIAAMWRYHTRTMGWRDIAQHLSIAPDGILWTGRDWNWPPASAAGYNGNAHAGPFMVETIGDFDRGRDRLEGRQLEAVLGVIARVEERFGLGADALRFHRQMTGLKSCPGTALDLDQIRAAVEATRAELRRARSARGADAWAGSEALRAHGRIDEVLRAWRPAAPRGPQAPDTELEESAMSEEQALQHAGVTGTTRAAPGADGRGARGPELTPEMLDALRPHVVNLSQGRLSGDGLFRTSRGDVDAIFDDHLARAAAEARANGRSLRLLFWAHGGLISEAAGLWIAHQQVAWWRRNGVYPVHFVWETGFLDALGQILSGARAAAPRGVRDLWDHTTDPAVEALARTLGGDKIWAAMKHSAELATTPDGGAAYVAARLAQFCQGRPGEVELHAVGHSAGSIFHAHFLGAAFALGVPPFRTLQLLAPAIRVDLFKRHLLPHVGPAVRALTMFTMKRDWERADSVAAIYRKSLLYLIHHALEPEREAPILGLEASVRDDAELVDLFGLRGRPAPAAEVVWSVTQATSGASASMSRSHGGFDNDRPTMDSVAHRILGTAPAVTFPEDAIERGAAIWSRPPALPPILAALLAGAGTPGGWPPVSTPAATAPTAPTPAAALPSPAAGGPAGAAPPGAAGRRRALCVGIDRYPTMPLAGCVNDARDWAQALAGLGFETTLLLDGAATRSGVLDALQALIGSGRAGDVVVFQFSGHGTEVDDLDGDEVDGSNGARDEALCPYDVAQGALVIDDDLAEAFAAIPDGVNVTCFVDCCHSGTITRLMVGPPDGPTGRDRRARFLPVTAELQAAHRRFRERLGQERGAAPRRTAAGMRHVVFSACRDYEVAYEVDGHGEFTVRATRILAAGVAGVSHDEFQRRVVGAFGAGARQHPELDCAPDARPAPLLVAPGDAAGATVPGHGGRSVDGARGVALARALHALADALSPGS